MTLFIVCGLPGSGKTTLARELAGESAIRFSPDEWLDALDISLWDESMRGRIEALQWNLAQNLLKLGVSVVIEWGTWARSERDVLREGAAALGARTELHYLKVEVEELWRRIQDRQAEHPPITKPQLEGWFAAFEKPSEEEMGRFDAAQTH